MLGERSPGLPLRQVGATRASEIRPRRRFKGPPLCISSLSWLQGCPRMPGSTKPRLAKVGWAGLRLSSDVYEGLRSLTTSIFRRFADASGVTLTPATLVASVGFVAERACGPPKGYTGVDNLPCFDAFFELGPIFNGGVVFAASPLPRLRSC